MDREAPPLVEADSLAGQAEQLSSRRAYQQAQTAHTEAAKQYQLAAQATEDTSAAKALLRQRDKQLRLAREVQSKLERGRSKPAVVTSSLPLSSPSTVAGAILPGGSHTNPHFSTITPSSIAPPSSRAYAGLGSPAHYYQPSSGNNGLAYRRNGGQPGPSIAGLQQYTAGGRLGPMPGTQAALAPRDRIDASTMADSRYSRRSNSPSQSQISQGVPHSGAESIKTSSVEESYYLMNTDNDPADPVTTFLTVVENMVEELGNAVAFASAPLHVGPPTNISQSSAGPSHERQTSDGTTRAKGASNAKQAGPSGTSNHVLESFYVVPSVNRPGKVARESSTASNEDPTSRPNSALNKTHEELVAENATLKETLDHLSKRLDWITKERQREKDTLKDSVTIFARDVRRQAERLGQSTANFTGDSRRQMPSVPLPLLHHAQHGNNGNNAHTEELQRKVASLQEELRNAKMEAEKQSANAQRYKTRYDDLRKAILEKRKAKEMAMAAAASSTPSKDGGEDGPMPKEQFRDGSTSATHEQGSSTNVTT